MAIALVASATGAGNPPTGVASMNTTLATLLVAVVSYFSNLGDFVDSRGNTWNSVANLTADSPGHRMMYSIPTSVGSGHTISIANTFAVLYWAAFSGVHASPVDGSPVSAAAASPGSKTPSEDNCLWIGSFGANFSTAPITVSSPFDGTIVSAISGDYSVSLAWEIQTTATARNPTWDDATGGGPISPKTIGHVFKAAAVAAGHPTMRRYGGAPFVGGHGVNSAGGNSGKMWGRSRSGGLVVPQWLADQERAA